MRILASIQHPYIISYKDAFYDNKSHCLCIIMEYAGSGDLLNKIKSMKRRRKYFTEEVIW